MPCHAMSSVIWLIYVYSVICSKFKWKEIPCHASTDYHHPRLHRRRRRHRNCRGWRVASSTWDEHFQSSWPLCAFHPFVKVKACHLVRVESPCSILFSRRSRSFFPSLQRIWCIYIFQAADSMQRPVKRSEILGIGPIRDVCVFVAAVTIDCAK